MTRRVTIMISDDLDRKVRQHQARTIQDSNNGCSYSKAVNDLLVKGI